MLVEPRHGASLDNALNIAKQLHCGAQKGCVGCKRIMAGTDPDVIVVSPNEKNTITIEMAHDVVDKLGKRASRPDATRIVIIESTKQMTIAAQNTLLKVIEEPPAHTIFLLLAKTSNDVLATIKSRSQVVFIKADESTVVNPDIIAQARTILSSSPFERILLVDKLSSDKELPHILDQLAIEVSLAVREQKASSQALKSMQNYFIDSNAGVANKHALTEMMIRL